EVARIAVLPHPAQRGRLRGATRRRGAGGAHRVAVGAGAPVVGPAARTLPRAGSKRHRAAPAPGSLKTHRWLLGGLCVGGGWQGEDGEGCKEGHCPAPCGTWRGCVGGGEVCRR